MLKVLRSRAWVKHQLNSLAHLRIFGKTFVVIALATPLQANRVWAQVRPDATLKSERSVVTPINERADRIDGGAARGGNLFHSFQEFNVGGGRGVFFANPAGIENILSRVTGNNPSNILGELGVLGQANLWLLNPNGVVFGPDARVNVEGSFFTSTADAIPLGEQGLFSAVEPGQSQLLSVSPGSSFFEQAVNQSGSIINQGSLSVGVQQSLGFLGDRVLHTGEITAPGGSVTLLGNQVSLEGPAMVDVSSFSAGGSVLIGGDIQGGTVANADRTFIGPDVVVDANALTQGDGGRVIVGADEVAGFYGQVNARGGSLSGNGGFVEVSGKEHVLFRGDVNTDAVNGETGVLVLDPVNITIANGSGDGAGDETDTFAGDDSGLAGSVLSQPLSEFDDAAPVTIYETELEGLSGNTNVSLQATNDIRVEDLTDDELMFAAGDGSIEFVADADADGLGSFEMQDDTDTLVTNGRDIDISAASLSLGNIDTSNGANDGGDVVLEAIGYINSGSITTKSISPSLVTPLDSGRGGDIAISSISGNIAIEGQVASSSYAGLGNSGRGGDISISATSGDIIAKNVNSSSSSLRGELSSLQVDSSSDFGNSDRGGDISISATSGDITTNNVDSSSTTLRGELSSLRVNSSSNFGNSGRGGDISISSISGDITTNNVNSSSSSLRGEFSYSFNSSRVYTTLTYLRVDSSSDFGKTGRGGDISFASTSGDINNNGGVRSFSNFISGLSLSSITSSSDFSKTGRGGDISFVSKSGDITTNENVASTSVSGRGKASRGGDISFTSTSGDIIAKARVSSFSRAPLRNSGRGGDISFVSKSGNITTRSVNTFSFSLSRSGNSGRGGDISFASKSGNIVTNGDVTSSSFSTTGNSGRGGDISFASKSGNIFTNRDVTSLSLSRIENSGRGGDIQLATEGGIILGNNSQFLTFSIADGDAGIGGIVTLESDDISGLEVFTLSSTGKSGNVYIQSFADNLKIRNVQLTTSGQVEIPDPFLRGESITIDATDFGVSGDTVIYSPGKILLDTVEIQSDSNGSNDAGNVIITSPGQIRLRNSQLNSNTNNSGNAGNITIQTDEGIAITGLVDQDYGIFAGSEGFGNAGNISINAGNSFILGANTQLAVETSDAGEAGNISVTSDQLTIGQDAQLSATATQDATNPEGGGNIDINASNLNISGRLGVFAETQGQSPAGTLTLQPNGDNTNLNIVFTNNGLISASTIANGLGGNINLTAPKAINIKGEGQISVTSTGSGNAGNININSPALNLSEGIEITASTSSPLASGGNIEVNSQAIRLNDADITTSVNSGTGGGGDILLNATNFILAQGDSDILAFSTGGIGGNINLNTPVFIGENFTSATEGLNPQLLDNNGIVNINASGEVSQGTINTPDNSIIEESLTELPDNLVDTNDLIANSCIVRTEEPQGRFVITGADRLRARPGYPAAPSFPTGTVRTIPTDKTAAVPSNRPWQIGDPIVEPESVYRLPDGELVISHECSE